MEEERMDMNLEETEETQQDKPHYVPRPMWQVWGARIGLVIFILGLILYYLNILRGGM